MPCTGNSAEICGGSSALSIYPAPKCMSFSSSSLSHPLFFVFLLFLLLSYSFLKSSISWMLRGL